VSISPVLRAELERCRAPASEAWSIPAPFYVDDELHDIEQAAVFRSGWVGLGRSDRWPAVGDFSAMTIGGVPIVVVRDDDQQLRAYANTCMHRNAQILSGDGNCSRMRCPFHFWTYALDGRLVSAPSMQKTTDFDRSAHGLVEFAVAERAGFVLVCLEEIPPPIEHWLAGFDDIHAPWPLESLVTARRREFTVNCNWKGFAEVFNEYYHLPYVHGDSIGDRYPDPDDCEDVSGAFATQFGVTDGPPALLDDAIDSVLPVMPGLVGREASGVRYSWMFPNIVTAIGAEVMWMYEVYPDGPGRTRCAQVVVVPPSTIEGAGYAEKIAAYHERFDVAIEEDIPVLERQYLGQRSPFARSGRFSYLEPAVARFADWYADRMLAT